MMTREPNDSSNKPSLLPDAGILTALAGATADITGTLVSAAATCKGDPEPMLAVLRDSTTAHSWPIPGERTLALWEMFARVAAIDLVAARTLEPHVDALTILNQSAATGSVEGAWGVFAAEGPNLRLDATADPNNPASFELNGTKPWCSLAAMLDSALISAHVEGGRQLFAIDLRHLGVRINEVDWASRGLARVTSGPVTFVNVPARPIGDAGWYLSRPGFAWGGAGVAACWFGGAFGLYQDLVAASRRREPDQLAAAWLGRAARLIRMGRATLREAAEQVDADAFAWLDALALRGTVAELCREILTISSHTLGPGALAFDESHARRVADLEMYIQQHHGARDDAEIGDAVAHADGWEPTAPFSDSHEVEAS